MQSLPTTTFVSPQVQTVSGSDSMYQTISRRILRRNFSFCFEVVGRLLSFRFLALKAFIEKGAALLGGALPAKVQGRILTHTHFDTHQHDVRLAASRTCRCACHSYGEANSVSVGFLSSERKNVCAQQEVQQL